MPNLEQVFAAQIEGLKLIQCETIPMVSEYTTGLNPFRSLEVKKDWLVKEVKADLNNPAFGGELRCYKTPDEVVILEDASGLGSQTCRYAYAK